LLTQSLTHSWSFRQLDSDEWLPAQVPGGVHTDLLRLGKISDPFFADEEKRVQWVAERDWEYQSEFRVDPALSKEERLFLVCDGLDTLAEVYLNDHLLGKTDNMFRQWRWEVSEALREGENTLRIIFRAPLTYIRQQQAASPLPGGGDIPGGPHLRKAPCQWGWDWGPKLPPIGIWKEMRLEGYRQARLEEVHVRQRVGEKALVAVRAGVQAWEEAEVELACTLRAPDGAVYRARQALQRCPGQPLAVEARIEVPEPQLWWPNGYGDQPLYRLEVRLEQGGALLDSRQYQVGLRTVTLRREPDQWGESFYFMVNGVPVFAKGADWIPADSFPTRLTQGHLEKLISAAAEAHMNMLRVWGGGFYESEDFYDLCDRYGILVWQDFVFACGIYPAEDDFAANVRQEAVENIRRLRHRASLALWCGNNEMEQGWVDWGWNHPEEARNQSLKAGYDRIFHHLLPDLVKQEDPDRAYWPSSASSGIPFAQPNGDQRGDMHYWDVWHGRKPFTAYRTQYPRFMSEFGFQALPTYETVQTYAPPEDQNMTSYVMEHHQRSGSGNGLIIAQMTATFRMPKDFEALVYLSMVLQAEGIRYGVEHWRRNRERIGGTLIWQLNDCWPVASWASLDYYGRWKALHYAAKRFYAPLLLSIEDQGMQMNVHLTSDLVTEWQGLVRWRVEQLDGRVLAQGEQPVTAAPLANTLAVGVDCSAWVNEDSPRGAVFVAELWQEGAFLAHSVCAFVPSKHLSLSDPQVQADVTLGDDGQALITCRSAWLARFVELSLGSADIVFSDNYFDLSPNRPLEVKVALPAGWSLEEVRKNLQVRSLFDSFNVNTQ